jgi:hypothetical protein
MSIKSRTTGATGKAPTRNRTVTGHKTPGEAAGDLSVRTIFLRRIRKWTHELARNAPSSVLADALTQTSARGTMIHVLSALAPTAEESQAQQLRDRALERGILVQEQLRDAAGGFRSTTWVADHLQVSRQSVDKRRRDGKLLALDTPAGYAFPACQFTAAGTVPGLEDALDAMQGGGFWETLAGLVTPSPALDGRSIVTALQAARTPADRQRVIAIARAYANE